MTKLQYKRIYLGLATVAFMAVAITDDTPHRWINFNAIFAFWAGTFLIRFADTFYTETLKVWQILILFIASLVPLSTGIPIIEYIGLFGIGCACAEVYFVCVNHFEPSR